MTPNTITISAHSLGIYDRCGRAYWYYKVRSRKAVRSAAALIAGTAMHEGFRLLQSGASIADQEQAVADLLLRSPPPPDDYRNTAYLRDALAAFRAEFATLMAGWTVEEQEAQGTVPLGYVYWSAARHPGFDGNTFFYVRRPVGEPEREIQVLWEFRRDLVGLAPDGRRYIVDLKTSSRNEDAQYLAFKNSGQFMGYLWSWNAEHPNTPAAGVLPIRVVMRKPSRTGVAFEFPHDPPIYFQPERVEEWRRHTLRKVAALLARDPQDPEDWPLACAELGLCRHTYGCCDYLPVCTLNPGQDRERMLASDAYEPADTDKAKP